MSISDFFPIYLLNKRSLYMFYVTATRAFCQPVSAHARNIQNVNNNNQLVYTSVRVY